MTDLRLLPCPFCGSTLIALARLVPSQPAQWQVWCGTCDAAVRPAVTEQLAVEAWNRRAGSMAAEESFAAQYHTLAQRHARAVEELLRLRARLARGGASYGEQP
jgi:Lar family restriction alleviation protein